MNKCINIDFKFTTNAWLLYSDNGASDPSDPEMKVLLTNMVILKSNSLGEMYKSSVHHNITLWIWCSQIKYPKKAA